MRLTTVTMRIATCGRQLGAIARVSLVKKTTIGRYSELCEEEVFDFIYKVEDNRLMEWKNLLNRFNPEDEDVRSSDYEAEIAFRDDFEDNSKVMRERVIAYHQLEAFSLYLKDKPAQLEAYHQFLVSKFSMVLACVLLQ